MTQTNNCEYCGNNPVPHFLTWYQETMNIMLTPIRRLLFFNPFAKLIGDFFERVNLAWRLVEVMHAVGVISYQSDIKACKVRRAQVLWEEAERRGFTMWELKLLGNGFDTYVAKKGDEVLVFAGLPRPASSRPEIVDVLDDKMIFKKKLLAAGLPVSRGICTRHINEALQTFELLQKPVIVKPRSGSRGRHSTTYLYTEDDLRRAFFIAKQLCSWVVVEEHIFGPVYRATVIGGKLAGVLRGDPPTVVGDGKLSIRELVEEKNNQPHPGVKDILLDHRSEVCLARQHMDFGTVPTLGQQVVLLEKIGVSYGGSSSEDIDICHPDNKALFLKAAAALEEPILGFDFIIEDITRSYKEQRAAFIEANTLPFINLHHDPLKGPSQNAAALVWDLIGW